MQRISNITEVRNTFRSKPIGSCIYCGATHELTDEHVIPYALGGNIILTDSSCHTCATITSDFERKVFRGFMQNARIAGKYPTRKPKKRPKILPLQIEHEGEFKHIDLLPEMHPGFLVLPLFEPPGILVRRQPSTGLKVSGYETLYFGKNPTDVANDLDINTMRTTENWDLSSFARLLAKIGYSYSVVALGLCPREQIPILPLILGKVDDASHWIGSADFKLDVEAKKPTHALAFLWVIDPNDSNKELLVVRVKLFVPSGATGYEIVVCRRDIGQV